MWIFAGEAKVENKMISSGIDFQVRESNVGEDNLDLVDFLIDKVETV